MNQSFQPDQLQQKIINLVPFLLELGRTGDRSVIDNMRWPNSCDFGCLWQQWAHVVSGWEAVQIADLIKGLTYYERMFDEGFGSVPPVANLYWIYASMVDSNERDQFADWILRNTVNDYTPYGTHNYGARSLEELKNKEEARSIRKQATAAREKARFEDAQSQKIARAAERLPNALGRKDVNAVVALLAKGADPDVIGASGKSAREIAQEIGVEAWLSGNLAGDQ